MDDKVDEKDVLQNLSVQQFIKGEEAGVEVIKQLRKCHRLNNTQLSISNNYSYCPVTFDGWMCWNATLAGKRAVNPCPSFVTGFDPERTAFKDCDTNGSWFKNPGTGQPWSNYSTCIDFEDLEWRKTINWVYMSGYSISLVALLISIFILTHFRALHCTRNILHINLFASFSINNLLWLIWYLTVVPIPDVLTANGSYFSFYTLEEIRKRRTVVLNAPKIENDENKRKVEKKEISKFYYLYEVWCQALFVITHYFMLTNYFWMLCEGFYLHSLLAFAFVIEEKLLKYVYMLGWGVPVLVIAGYAGLRIANYDNIDCWIHESAYSHVLIIPVVISLCINLVFLVSILRVLLLKIRTNTNQGPNRNELIKVFRAAFVLVPLLGLHYTIVLVRPETDMFWEREHEILSAVSASYQGLCVACLFCFLNNESELYPFTRWTCVLAIVFDQPKFDYHTCVPPDTKAKINVHAQIRRRWYQIRGIQNNQVFSTCTGSTYALERRATRCSGVAPQGNEISPMLIRFSDTSPLEQDDHEHLQPDLSTISLNGMKNALIRGDNAGNSHKKSVKLVDEHQGTTIRANGTDLMDGINLKPLIKTTITNGNERIYLNKTETAEDYV